MSNLWPVILGIGLAFATSGLPIKNQIGIVLVAAAFVLTIDSRASKP